MLNIPTEEWVRTYAGFVMHDEGTHWMLSFWGYPITTGTEERCGMVYNELVRELTFVLEERDRVAT